MINIRFRVAAWAAVVLLAACGEGASQEQVKRVTVADSPKSAASAPENLTPEPLTASAPSASAAAGNAADADLGAAAPSADASRVREFNPADFPDACNDYVDAVSQCITVMEKNGLEGTASLQMQLDEMQASWLMNSSGQERDLEAVCSEALSEIHSALHDLGC